MGFHIEDGTGSGKAAKVNTDNQLEVRSVTQSSFERATSGGNSFNINTGLITLTSAGESGILYVKNTSSTKNIRVDGVVVILGPSTGGATTDTTHIRFYKNPTTGTLISGASAVSDESNRNFGSGITLEADSYKGAEGNTITDGTTHIQSLVSPGNRVFFSIDEVLQPGNSTAVSYEPPDSNTSMKCMAALLCHTEPI